jgi:hypothetical protein
MRGRRILALGGLLALVLTGQIARADAPPYTGDGASDRVRLDGPWILRSDHADTGMAQGWARGGFAGSSVTVPNAANARPDRLTGPKGKRAFDGTIAWYRTSFAVPTRGVYALDFESVNHTARVWVDGRYVGGHTGEFMPFETTFHLRRAGRHVLVVRTDYRHPLAQARDGFHKTWFNYGGITREVTLRPLYASDLVYPTVNTTLSGGGAVVSVSVHVRNRGPTRAIAVDGTLDHGDQSVPITFPEVRIRHGGTRIVSARVRVPQPALWSPAHPQLYDLGLEVSGEGTWSGRVGLRQVSWRGRRLLLNGRRLILKGASLQEDAYGHGTALTGADMDRIVSELEAIGANATRSQHPLNPALLERLDAAGILVWQEIGPDNSPGNWEEKSARLQRVWRERTISNFLNLQAHPSILVWSLANEVAQHGHRGGEAAWIDSMARELHRRDPGRPVGLDVWGPHAPRSDRGVLLYRHIDIVGLTNYIGWYTDSNRSGASLQRLIAAKARSFERAFADKVVLVSEFGAEANPLNASAVPGGYGFQARLLADHLAVYRADPRLSGMLIWALRDFAVNPRFAAGSITKQLPGLRYTRGLNQKGLFAFSGKAKPAVAVVADAFGAP